MHVHAHLVSQTFGLPPPVPTGWIRGWGATLILVTALYVPGLQDPLRSRAANIIGIFGRVWMATVWLCLWGLVGERGFFWFGLFRLELRGDPRLALLPLLRGRAHEPALSASRTL